MFIFNNKTSAYFIVITLIGSVGLGGGNLYISAIDDVDDRLTNHIINDSPHVGTTAKLEHILEYQMKFEQSYLEHQKEDLQTRQQLIKEIQDLKLVICQLEDINCKDLI